MPPPPPPRARALRVFFAHLGTLVSIVVYVVIAGRAGWSADGVTRGVWTALALQSAYLSLAWRLGEHKQLDVVLWMLYAVGAAAALAGIAPVLGAYQRYFGALLFGSFAIAAVVPLLLGRDPFTVWHAVRQTPRWQHGTPAFAATTRVLAGFWGAIFLAAALLCAARPADPLFTLVYPNLLVVVGVSASRWLPPLWFKRFPPALPDRAEPLIMGMPLVFDARAAQDARALIQFRVSGEQAGDYFVRVAGGRCESFAGSTDGADLTLHVPDDVWVRIVSGELDATRAIMERRMAVEGEYGLLAKLREWFPSTGA